MSVCVLASQLSEEVMAFSSVYFIVKYLKINHVLVVERLSFLSNPSMRVSFFIFSLIFKLCLKESIALL